MPPDASAHLRAVMGLVVERLAERHGADLFYNENHDERGRFAGDGSGGGSGEKPGWSGDGVMEQDGHTLRTGRFNNKDSWGVDDGTGNPPLGGFHKNPADAVSTYNKIKNEGQQDRAYAAKRDEAASNIKSGSYTDDDVNVLANGSRLVTRTAASGMLSAIGVPNKGVSSVMSRIGVYGTTGAGGDLYKPREVVDEGVRQIGQNHSVDPFAARPAGRPRKEVAAVDAYQARLQAEYDAWADDCARQLAAEPDDDKRRALLLLLLLLLLRRLTKLGQDHLPDAVRLGGASSAPIFAKLAELLGENAATLKDSLIPAIQAKIEAALADADVQLALKAGQGTSAIKAVLSTITSRVGSYAGQWWRAYNQSVGIKSVEDGVGLLAHLDPRAHHCEECPEFHAEGGKPYASFGEYLQVTGDRTPGDFICKSGCRCWLEFDSP